MQLTWQGITLVKDSQKLAKGHSAKDQTLKLGLNIASIFLSLRLSTGMALCIHSIFLNNHGVMEGCSSPLKNWWLALPLNFDVPYET